MLVATIAMAACGQAGSETEEADRALEVLAGPYRSAAFGRMYWIQASDQDADLWARGVQFCEGKDEQQYPNCEAVRYAAAIKRGEEPQVDSTSLMMGSPTWERDTTSR